MMQAKPQHLELSRRGIYKITRQMEEELTLQAINFKKMKHGNKISCELSDGVHKLKAYISDPSMDINDQGAIIEIHSYGLLAKQADANNHNNQLQNNSEGEKKVKNQILGVLIHLCKTIDHYEGIIGQPIDILNKDKEVVELQNPIYPNIDKNKLKSCNTTSKSGKKTVDGGPIEKKNNGVTLVLEESQPQEDILDNSQKISDLYIDLANWQIVARIVKKSYRQFVSKNQGKLTKVLNVELMDNTGMKITGAMFGESSIQFYNALEEDQVYRISKGQIREDTFNQKKAQNFSKFTIMFTRHSEFRKLPSQFMASYQTKHQSLSDVLKSSKMNQQYDIFAILLNIHEEVELPKQTRTLIKQSIELYDPEKDIVMEAVIWNRTAAVKKQMLGHVVGFYNWRLGKFNDNWSFNSVYNSEIKILQGQKRSYLAQYDNKIDLQAVKERKNNKEYKQSKEEKEQFHEQQMRYLKDIEQQVLSQNRQLKSTAYVHISFVGYKKWHYQSCPYCRKSAQPQSKCPHCEKIITETIPKFKLNTELSDFTGSIWATGFQQFGHKIFSEYFANPIKQIMKLDEDERRVVFEKTHFKLFIVKLTSKIDRDGTTVKHTINRIVQPNILARISDNYSRILKQI